MGWGEGTYHVRVSPQTSDPFQGQHDREKNGSKGYNSLESTVMDQDEYINSDTEDLTQ